MAERRVLRTLPPRGAAQFWSCATPLGSACTIYLQNGQQPVPPNFAAAAAVVANNATTAAVNAKSVDFIVSPLVVVTVIRHAISVEPRADLKVNFRK